MAQDVGEMIWKIWLIESKDFVETHTSDDVKNHIEGEYSKHVSADVKVIDQTLALKDDHIVLDNTVEYLGKRAQIKFQIKGIVGKDAAEFEKNLYWALDKNLDQHLFK